MPQFQYQARDANGRLKQGRRHALSEEELAMQLQEESLVPLEIKATSSLKKQYEVNVSIPTFFKGHVRQDELQMLCRQLHTVLKAGVPIGIAIARIAETTRDKTLAQALKQILAHLNQGQTVSSSLAKFPRIFSSFFVNLVRVGETTGKLDLIFLHLADYLELEIDTKKKIKTALRYPLLVFIATLVALLVINAFVIPAFAEMFHSFKGALPLMTRLLITTSEFITGNWYLLLAMAIIMILFLRYYVKTSKGRMQWATLQLRLPVVGWLIKRLILTRFARLLALVLRAGVTAVEAIELVGASSGNAYFTKQIKTIAVLVGRGNSMAHSISEVNLFPPLVLQMITLGEETGKIDVLLDEVAEFYQREIEYDLVRLSDAIEPIMLAIMGIMVLILALGVFLPMWQMATQLN